MNNLQHGHGVQTWPDKSQYIGNWENGKPNGNGKFIH